MLAPERRNRIIQILNENSIDISKYYDLTIQKGVLTILKKEITIKTFTDIKTYDGKETDYVPERTSERINLKDYNYLNIIKEGMRMVSLDDSAKPYQKFPVQVGSKTGTAQNQGINPDTGKSYDDFAWYVAFAPYDDPQIAVACVLFEGGSGRYPIPIVREVIGEYLELKNEQ